MIERKRCKRCLSEKPASAFHKHQGSGDGLQTWCKRCLLRQQRLARAARTVAKAVKRKAEISGRAQQGKACSCCGTVKLLPDFGADKRRPDGRQSVCKSCAAPARREACAKYRAKRSAVGHVSKTSTDAT